jgi:hypothetical protein
LIAVRQRALLFGALLLVASLFAAQPRPAGAEILKEHFCWGVTLAAKNTHSEADECTAPHFGIIEAEAWSPQHSVCLEFTSSPHEQKCSTAPEQHVVIKSPVVCAECATYLRISNNAESSSTVYGNVTYVDGKSESPPPPPPLKKIDELGFVRFNQSSGNSHIDVYGGAPSYSSLLSASDTGYPAITDPNNVQALPIDVNGDGIKELAFIRFNQASGNAHISVYTDAPGYKTLVADCNTAYPAISDPQNVQVMAIDTNGDGVSELAFVRLHNPFGNARIDIYKGAPCYQTLYSSNELTYPSVADPQNVHAMAIDVNGDFKDELMFVRYNYSSGNAQAVTYRGAPGYTTLNSNCTTAYPAVSDPQNLETIAVDSNGDGIDELGFLRYNYSSGNTQLVTYMGAPCYTTLASASATAYPAVSDPQNVQGMAINTNGS